MDAFTNKDDDVSKKISRIGDISIENNQLAICANCGKEVISNPNICNKCKAATYCNATCKKKHRHKHKQDCEKHITEFHEEELERKKRAAELHDEKLVKQPPPMDDCPICMLLLPSLHTGWKYRACCGKRICSGCMHAVAIRDRKEQKCPFCRTPAPTPKEAAEQNKKRMEIGDAVAIYSLGCNYSNGLHGLPQDHAKALELYHRAGELGYAGAYHNIGCAYYEGNGVERDEKKAIHYWELAAMRGHVTARHVLGCVEEDAGNLGRALKHYMIAAGCGYTDSLNAIKQMFMNGGVTKDDYVKALRAYQAYLVEIKSPQRNEAAATDEIYKYY